MRVQVYYNLHKHKWSVKNKKTGLVIGHCDYIALGNAKYTVQKGGRARVLKDQTKNVHAWVEGDINPNQALEGSIREVTYNPYKYETFVDKKDESFVYYADQVLLSHNQVTAYNR